MLRRIATACALAVALISRVATAQSAVAHFTVDTAVDRGPVNRDVYGADLEYIGADAPDVRAVVSGTSLVRFPGGDDQSLFRWDAPTLGACTQPQWTWPSLA